MAGRTPATSKTRCFRQRAIKPACVNAIIDAAPTPVHSCEPIHGFARMAGRAGPAYRARCGPQPANRIAGAVEPTDPASTFPPSGQPTYVLARMDGGLVATRDTV